MPRPAGQNGSSRPLIYPLERQIPVQPPPASDEFQTYLIRPAPSDHSQEPAALPPHPLPQTPPCQTPLPAPSPARKAGSSRRRTFPAYTGNAPASALSLPGSYPWETLLGEGSISQKNVVCP